MSVAVLHPQDCFKQTVTASPHMKHPRNSNANVVNRTQSNRRKRSPSRSNKPSIPSRTMVISTLPAKNLVMGQVKILKRGEDLSKTTPEQPVEAAKFGNGVDPDLGSTELLGPDPILIPTQIRLAESNRAAGFYAGSAFFTSPPPSSLPLPAFFTRKCIGVKTDDATSDLRRMLRLDL